MIWYNIYIYIYIHHVSRAGARTAYSILQLCLEIILLYFKMGDAPKSNPFFCSKSGRTCNNQNPNEQKFVYQLVLEARIISCYQAIPILISCTFITLNKPPFLGENTVPHQPCRICSLSLRSLNDLNHTPAKLSLANYTWRPGGPGMSMFSTISL